MGEAKTESLLAEYQEMCKLDAAIRDLRAKLLGALPVVSGAAAALLVDSDAGERGWLLVGAGLFGAAVTLGFFIFERQGQEVCIGLVARGREVEGKLQIMGGVFGDRLVLPKEARRIPFRKLFTPSGSYPPTRPHVLTGPEWSKIEVSIPTASKVVYGATFAAWIGVVAVGVITIL